jgi:hypothetical protein
MFTTRVDYAKAAFYLYAFLKSLENLNNESLLKELEKQVDKRMWVSKDGLRLVQKQWPLALGNNL